MLGKRLCEHLVREKNETTENPTPCGSPLFELCSIIAAVENDD